MQLRIGHVLGFGRSLKKNTYKIESKELNNGWIEGKIEGFTFQTKIFDEGSEYGINEGRVSKLMIWDTEKRQATKNVFTASIVNYDRGWDIKPKAATDKLIFKAVLDYLENYPVA